MDRIHLEPRNRLHQDQSRLQTLLCRAHVHAPRGNGTTELPRRLQIDSPAAYARIAAAPRKPQRIFVNSMSDLFHRDVPLEYIQSVFDVMHRAHWHQFQLLTKRADRLAELSSKLMWKPNIWMGVSVENEKYASRIEFLRTTGAHIKFLSIEPLLGHVGNLDLRNIDWVIVGGESGPGRSDATRLGN